MCTSPPVSNVIPEEHECIRHRELTIASLSVSRQIRRLAIETWYDTHWYGAYGKLEHYGFELYTYFAFTNTFYCEGRNILMPVDVYKGAQEMNRVEAMEKLRYYLSFYQALRRLVVVLVPQKWCPDNGLVEELMVMIENALALYAQERVASRSRFRYKVKLCKNEEWL